MTPLALSCRWPGDSYINYDCDVQCTNLFETICRALASHALPSGPRGSHGIGRLNSINRLALEGVLAVISAIAQQCQRGKAQQARSDQARAMAKRVRPHQPVGSRTTAARCAAGNRGCRLLATRR